MRVHRGNLRLPPSSLLSLSSLSVIVLVYGCDQTSQPQVGELKGSTTATATPWFEDMVERSDLSFVGQSSHSDGNYILPDGVCGGGALFDMDGDGDLDVYLVQSGRIGDPPASRPGNKLFENQGDWKFVDVTESSGAGNQEYGMGVVTGDYDNDGDLDLYVANLGPNVLYRNEGGGRFTDVTARAGVGHDAFGAGCAFVDYDADGDLDLYVANYLQWNLDIERKCSNLAGEPDYCSPSSYDDPSPDVLYRNEGDGTFTDVSVEAGLRAAYGNGLGVVCGDYDGDGWIDIFVANDTSLNQLWLNQGDGTFKDVAMITGCAMDQHGQAKAGMGTTAADVDDDGDLDIMVVNLRSQSDSFYRNHGEFFTDDTGKVGLGVTSQLFTRFGLGLIDFDNDGWLDVYEANGRVNRLSPHEGSDDPYAEPNLLLAGSSSGRFQEVSPRGGTSPILIATSRAAAFGDVDNDGGIDILIVNRDAEVHLLRNVVSERGHWVRFRVIDQYGKDALNAIVTVTLADRTMRRDVQTAYSYFAGNDPRVHFGLGDVTQVGVVTVRWLDGAVESFDAPVVDMQYELRRGAGATIEP